MRDEDVVSRIGVLFVPSRVHDVYLSIRFRLTNKFMNSLDGPLQELTMTISSNVPSS